MAIEESPEIGCPWRFSESLHSITMTRSVLAILPLCVVTQSAFPRRGAVDVESDTLGFAVDEGGRGAKSAIECPQMWRCERAYLDGIKPAIENCAYDPIRVDQTEDTGKIDDRVITELRRSRFVVADFTQESGGARGGVYYEAGFAHALDIPVIFTCHKDCMKDFHFDTRQFVHIDWKDPDDLRGRLSLRINAVVI